MYIKLILTTFFFLSGLLCQFYEKFYIYLSLLFLFLFCLIYFKYILLSKKFLIFNICISLFGCIYMHYRNEKKIWTANYLIEYRGKNYIYCKNLEKPFSYKKIFIKKNNFMQEGEQYKLYLKKKNNYTQIQKYKYIKFTENNFIINIRRKIWNFLSYSKYSEIFQAIILGDKSFIDSFTLDLFKKNSTIHILVISGLHINILLFCIYSMLNKVLSGLFFLNSSRIKNTILFLSILLLGNFYLRLCLYPVSGIRALIFFLINLYFFRSINRIKNLILTLWIMLLMNPLWIFDYSFIFSFLSCFIILHNKWNVSYFLIYFLPVFNIFFYVFNFLTLKIMNLLLPFLLITILLQNIYLLKLCDFLWAIIYKIQEFPSIYMEINIEPIKFLYFLLIIYTILFGKFKYIIIIFYFIVFLHLLIYNY
jgi:competence protein ComEC